MNIRNFKPEDYETICSWYKAHGEYPTPIRHMPTATTFVICDGETPVASLGYFTTNTDIALAQNVIGNPNVDRAVRKAFVTILFDFLDNHAKKNGFNILTGFTSQEKLATRYQELGWTTKPMIFCAKEI